MDLRDRARLVGDGRPFRDSGRNPVVELLPLEDRHHLGVGACVDRLPSGQLLQKHRQAMRRRRVAHALVERLLILHAAPDVHAGGAEARDGRPDVLDAQPLDQEVGRQVAADRDHGLAQLAQRHRLADRLVDLRVRVVADLKVIDAAVHDAVEVVHDRQRVVEAQAARLGLPEQLDHHRHLHRARRVEHLVGFDRHRAASIQGLQHQPDLGGRPSLALDERVNPRHERGIRRTSWRSQDEQQEPGHGDKSMACARRYDRRSLEGWAL